MIELILPEQPVVSGQAFTVKIRWEGPQDLELLEVSFGWIFHDGKTANEHVLAREEFKWPGRAGEEIISWQLPDGPYSFDAAAIFPQVGLSYVVEVKAKPGRLKLIETLPTLAPGNSQPIVLHKTKVPAELQLPRLLKFTINHS